MWAYHTFTQAAEEKGLGQYNGYVELKTYV
jgi:hypothetical protein